MGRLKRSSRSSVAEDDAGLAGWLYTDLLLGLAVVFLAGTAFVVPALSADDELDDAIPASSTSSTTTTTTIPVEYCTSLYAVDGSQDDKTLGVWVVIDRNTRDVDSMVNEFEQNLRSELEQENFALLGKGTPPFEIEDLKIGLVIVYGGYSSSETPNDGQLRGRNVIYPAIRDSRLSYLFAGGDGFPPTIQRFIGTRKDVGANQVGFDIFPYIESPC